MSTASNWMNIDGMFCRIDDDTYFECLSFPNTKKKTEKNA